MLVELNVVELRYQAVLEVLRDGATEIAGLICPTFWGVAPTAGTHHAKTVTNGARSKCHSSCRIRHTPDGEIVMS
jgi:hypothetical protein